MKKFALSLVLVVVTMGITFAQCETWINSSDKDAAEEAHMLYRDRVKAERFDDAYDYWQKAYTIAPAADGNRDWHYSDGIKIYMHKFQNESDAAKKEEYKKKIYELYDQMVSCYENRVIKLKDCNDECYQQRIGNIMASKAYDMYYYLRPAYSTNLEVAEQALKLAGNDVDYSVFEPAMSIAVYQYEKGLVDADKVREIHAAIDQISQYNIENDQEYGQYYEDAAKRAFAAIKPIESEIFDCEYFKKKLMPKYEENPTDFEVLKYVISTLRATGCTEDDAFLTKLNSEYESLAAEYNANVLAEKEAANPALAASRLYREGDFEGALAKYEDALAKETDEAKKADYYFSMASIKFRKLKKYADARSSALKSIGIDKNYGKAYALIGDMYATSARNCGDSWDQRLAVLAAMDKYRAAKKADPSLTDDMNQKIGRLSGSTPEKADMHMRGMKPGSKVTVGCWIGERVTLPKK